MNAIDLKLLDSRKTAVLVIDMQNAYCSPVGSSAKLGYDISPIIKMSQSLKIFLEGARDKKMLIIFTRMIEDKRFMSENARIKIEAKNYPALSSPRSKNMNYYAVSPRKKEIEIIKNSYDAFTNIKLEKILFKKQIKNIIVTGVNSDVCVDSTIRSGFSKGYNIIVPRELVATIKQNRKHHTAMIEIWDTVFAHLYNYKGILNFWRQI